MPEKTVACQSCETEISGTGRLNQKFFHCHTCVTQRGPRNFDNRTWTDCTSDLESHANHFVPLTADPNSRAGNGPRCQAAKSGGPIFQRLTVAHNAYCQRGSQLRPSGAPPETHAYSRTLLSSGLPPSTSPQHASYQNIGRSRDSIYGYPEGTLAAAEARQSTMPQTPSRDSIYGLPEGTLARAEAQRPPVSQDPTSTQPSQNNLMNSYPYPQVPQIQGYGGPTSYPPSQQPQPQGFGYQPTSAPLHSPYYSQPTVYPGFPPSLPPQNYSQGPTLPSLSQMGIEPTQMPPPRRRMTQEEHEAQLAAARERYGYPPPQ